MRAYCSAHQRFIIWMFCKWSAKICAARRPSKLLDDFARLINFLALLVREKEMKHASNRANHSNKGFMV